MIFFNFSVLKISFLCSYLERDVKLHYLNGDTEVPIFRTNLREAVNTACVVSLIINEEFDSNVVCHKNQFYSRTKLLFYNSEIISKSPKLCFFQTT